VSDQHEIDSWERLRQQEREARDARIREDLERIERITKSLADGD
jgi:hypothetical protein